jgi:hypothetical protein
LLQVFTEINGIKIEELRNSRLFDPCSESQRDYSKVSIRSKCLNHSKMEALKSEEKSVPK